MPIAYSVSQPARFMNDYVWLGFNEDAAGGKVFDGVHNWLGAGTGVAANVRFALPHKTERNRKDKLHPEASFLGIDINADMIRIAETFPASEGLSNLEFRVADVVAGEVKEKFDFIFTIRVFQNIESAAMQKTVFDAVRRHADAVLVEAGTIRAEGYGALRAKDADAQARRDQGQAPAPVIAIVSPSLDLPWDSELFTGSTEPPLVLTTRAPDETALARAREARAVVVHSESDDVPPRFLVDTLVGRGLRRIVCEGGPRLLEAVARAGLVDEADITVSPLFAGLGHASQTDGLEEVVGFDLAHVLTADGFLMCRYVRGDA